MAGTLLLTTAVAGCHSRTTATDDEVPAIDVAQVQVDSITIYKTYPGTLSASHVVNAVARVNGYLRSINFNGGDYVRKGQVLFTIEDQTYRDAVAQAQAQLATARSSNEYATKQYAAMKKALESDAVSQMEVLQAKNAMEESAAAISQAQAALQTARTNLSYCTVTALVDGHISSNTVDVGAYVSGEGAPFTLATIYDDIKLNATFFIEDAGLLNMLTPANSAIDYNAIPITFSEALAHDYTGDLFYTAPSIDTGTGTLKLQASVRNNYGELRDGMYAEVKLPCRQEPKAMLVKDAAISTDQLGKYLYVVNDSDKVVYTPIEVGDLYHDTLRVVTSGLKPTDRYVTKALLKVRDGMTVKPVIKN